MNKISLQLLSEALERLVAAPNYYELKQEVIKLTRTKHGGFVGALSSLNSLVDYGRLNGEDALKSLWVLADRKHVQAYPGASKNPYQAAYMAQRRERLAKAIKLYQSLKGVVLRGAQREEFRRAVQAAWMMERDMLVADRPPSDERNELVQAFWQDIDDQLDKALAGDDVVARQVLGLDT